MTHKSVLLSLYIVGIVVIPTTLCSAQEKDGFVPGYILTLENDTLRGFLRVEDKDHLPSPAEMSGQRKSTTLAFKEKSSSRVKSVNLSEIKGYSINNHLFLTKKRLYFEKKFWDQEIAGPVTMYASDDKIRIHHKGYNANTNQYQESVTERESHYRMLERDGGTSRILYRYDRLKPDMDKKLKMSLINFFHDRPDLVDLIEQNDYKKSDIPLLVNAYNEPEKFKLLPMEKKK